MQHAPEDLVEVGQVAGAYGVQGWVKLHPHSRQAEALLAARRWWIGPEQAEFEVMQARRQGAAVVAQLVGVANRELVQSWKGRQVWVRRSAFPVPDEGEYYWVDLIGAGVENLDGQHLGAIAALFEAGAHPVMRVVAEDGTERLIPFVGDIVCQVDQPDGRKATRVVVDWGLDWGRDE